MAKYTLEEMHEMILPMIQSLGNRRAEELTDAIVELIKQDREAHARTPNPTEEMAANND